MWPLIRHTSRRTFIKDVHKVIGYISPYNEDDTRTILSRINSSEAPEDLNAYLSKPRANILYQRISQNGPLQNIETLLDLKKFDPKVVESMSKKILKSLHGNSNSPVFKKKSTSNYLKCISPMFSESPKANSFVTFRVYPDSVSYVHFNRHRREVTEMKSASLKISGFEKSFQFEVHQVLDQLRSIANEIPPASFFIQEKSAPISPRDSAIPFRVAIHSLNIIFITLLYEKKYGMDLNLDDSPNFIQKSDFLFQVRPSLVNNMFNLKIGSERISGSSRINHLLRQDPNSPFYLNIGEELWNQNFIHRSPMHQEKLSQVLLLTSAFDFVHKVAQS